ncbi:MAG: HlyC/CorC family transporter [Deltaproteobacteria bacterium]|nr:HlyC/CorC family transporter [Deltaproteobacteria bacterium]MBW2393535.1 HlyC/CorC family transporter [Deltaproteobacteria bacterium]
MDALSLVIVIVVCLLLSAFFSGSETALLRLAPHDLDEEVKALRGPAALAARDLLDHTSRLLVTILLGNNLVNILAASAASLLAIHALGEGMGILVSTVVMTVLVLVFCEVLPKAAAAAHPRRIGFAVALPIYVLHQVLRPVHAIFDRLVEPVVRRVGGTPEGSDTAAATEAVLRIARANASGKPEGTPLAIIGATAGAANMTVEEIMVPRTEITAFPVSIPPVELLESVLEERYTRVPIYRETIDDVAGMVHLKDLIELVRKGGTDVADILKPLLRVPERKPILRLLQEMQRSFMHMALVKDEFGVTLGLCTAEDILEEIVGEIRDEFDREELQTIREAGGDAYEALGRVKVLDFNRETGWEVPAERGDSLGGLVFNTLGHAPKQGDRADLEGFTVTVIGISGSRITRVRVARGSPQEATG